MTEWPGWVTGPEYMQLNNQAMLNSGLPSLYSDESIAATAISDGYNMITPNNNFRNTMLKNSMAFRTDKCFGKRGVTMLFNIFQVLIIMAKAIFIK